MMTIKDHIRNLSYIMDSMSDDTCGDWRDSLAYAIEILKQASDDCDCYTCTHGTWKRKGWDITMADDACGGCCSWNSKYELLSKQNLSKDDDTVDIINQLRKEFIDRYPKNCMGGWELDGRSCVFSLNQVLQILNKYR